MLTMMLVVMVVVMSLLLLTMVHATAMTACGEATDEYCAMPTTTMMVSLMMVVLVVMIQACEFSSLAEAAYESGWVFPYPNPGAS